MVAPSRMNKTSSLLDELFRVELRIARRADELARRLGDGADRALEPWRQAEREFWEGPGELRRESTDDRLRSQAG